MRSLLFAPADSDRKLEKAFASGTDAVIIDFEDSVALESKPLARARAAQFLKSVIGLAQRPRLFASTVLRADLPMPISTPSCRRRRTLSYSLNQKGRRA
jgi:HpcH/HpaI aldolase/citrate lyase family